MRTKDRDFISNGIVICESQVSQISIVRGILQILPRLGVGLKRGEGVALHTAVEFKLQSTEYIS